VEYEEVPFEEEFIDEPIYEYEDEEEEEEEVVIRAAPQPAVIRSRPSVRSRTSAVLMQPQYEREAEPERGYQRQARARPQGLQTQGYQQRVQTQGYQQQGMQQQIFQQQSNGIPAMGVQDCIDTDYQDEYSNGMMNQYAGPRTRPRPNQAPQPWEPVQPKPLLRTQQSAAPAYNNIAPRPAMRPMSTNMASRLDQAPVIHENPGYKVMVSNLHVKVTLDDIKELFGNVGPLSSARMLQSGTAEVIFVREVDATGSVNMYHNRLLDGKPMSVVVGQKKMQQTRQMRPNSGSFTTNRPMGQTNGSFLRSARGGRSAYM